MTKTEVELLKEELKIYKDLAEKQANVLKDIQAMYSKNDGLSMQDIIRRNSQLTKNNDDINDKLRISVDSILKYSKQLNLF
jgi:hypothetical protein